MQYRWFNRGLKVLLLLLLLLSNVRQVIGQGTVAVPIARLALPPRIDGQLDADEWRGSVTINQFYPIGAMVGLAAPATVVYIGYDDQNFYVAFNCWVADGTGLRAGLVKRDELAGQDQVTMLLDTFGNQQRAYQFSFNPLGVPQDAIVTVDPRNNQHNIDPSFDVPIVSVGRVSATGYVVEAAIPLAALQYPNSSTANWGLQLRRLIAANNETLVWPKTTPSKMASNIPRLADQAYLIGFNNLPRRRPLELVPTIIASETGRRVAEDKFLNPPPDLEPGLLIKYQGAPNIKATVALQPDFNETPGDFPQIEVNNRFPLFFPERRPLFTEDANFWRSRLDLVYTRQIVNPQVVGKLAATLGRSQIGFLAAIDEDVSSRRFSNAHEPFIKDALFLALRAQRSLTAQWQTGITVTDREFAGSFNRAFSVDLMGRNQQWGDIQLQLVRTLTKDLNGDHRNGYALAVGYQYQQRRNAPQALDFAANYDEISPNYRVDTGFVLRTNLRQLSVDGGYSFNNISRIKLLPKLLPALQSLRLGTQYQLVYNYQGELTDREVTPKLILNLRRNTTITAAFTDSYILFARQGFNTQNYDISLSSQLTPRLSSQGNFSLGRGILFDPQRPAFGRRVNYNWRVLWMPRDNLRVQLDLLHRELQQLEQPSVRKFFNASIYRASMERQFTRRLSGRGTVMYNNFNRRANGSFLLTYALAPNTALFIGNREALSFGDNRFTTSREDGLVELQRNFFVKLSYSLRL